jgi:hypothetical protein
MAKKMQIKLMPNGEIRMETHGVKGKKCDDYVELFKKLVNVNIVDLKHTEEYYETETMIESDNNAEIRTDY